MTSTFEVVEVPDEQSDPLQFNRNTAPQIASLPSLCTCPSKESAEKIRDALNHVCHEIPKPHLLEMFETKS